jgi:hypothetical protein
MFFFYCFASCLLFKPFAPFRFPFTLGRLERKGRRDRNMKRVRVMVMLKVQKEDGERGVLLQGSILLCCSYEKRLSLYPILLTIYGV